MQIAIGVGGAASGRERDWEEHVEFVVEAEKLGADFVWTAEAWGQDAISPLAYLAARTSRIRLGTGIMQISARTPSMTAMTALTMAAISNDRFVLGLGASGPQVVEGLQGQPFARPLQRMRETIEIVRMAFRRREAGQYQGRAPHAPPAPAARARPCASPIPRNPQNIPIYLATLEPPKALELTGELADGWLGTSFTPEHADAFFPAPSRRWCREGRTQASLEHRHAWSEVRVAFGDDVDAPGRSAQSPC